MGNGGSQEAAESVGYRVLGVQPHSPASKIGLVSFFDFIVAANGVPLRTLDSTFIDLIKASEDKPLPLTVFNCKAGTTRELVLVPSRKWPGEGMLGVTIRFDTYANADESLCRVLEVEKLSPAALAGLQPGKDYLLGTAERVFKDPDILHEELQKNIDKPMEIYVYNTETDDVRVVVLMPSYEWGGEGCLGADIGYGYLHRLPAKCCATLGRSSEGGCVATNSPFGANDVSAVSNGAAQDLQTVPLDSTTEPTAMTNATTVAAPPAAAVEN